MKVIKRKPYCPNWYPEQAEKIQEYLSASKEKIEATFSFAIAPHAGWIYSGKVAGMVYSSLALVDTTIFLATNHTGLGTASSLFPSGIWEMPLGTVAIDENFSKELLSCSKVLKPDIEAHLYEHAIEVQIPFLQVLNPKTKIVPIEMRDYHLEICKEIGQSISQVIQKIWKKNPGASFAIIASTDMTHCGENYGQLPPKHLSPDVFARQQDKMAIEQILNLNPEGLLNKVKEQNITMCGSGPAAAVIQTAKELGANKGELLAYSTSADVTGKDAEMAVGYAGILIR